MGFNNTTYNLESVDDIKFTSQNASLRVTTYWPKNLIWGNDLKYSYNGNVGPGFRKDALFWNMSLGLQMMEDKGTLKVLAYDLLDQNINTRRTTGEDFIQDFQGTVLQQYFMASFTYKFDQFGGKKPNSGDGRRYYN
ncbi:MAG: outer membrane beta-barrel protein [Arenibacter sp.]